MILRDKVYKIEVYDLEVYPNLFSYTGIDVVTNKEVVFQITEEKNQIEELLLYIVNLDAMIGFNNENYDYPILHWMIYNSPRLKKLSAQEINYRLYEKSQEIINSEYSSIRDKNKYIVQIDLFKINHFDNANKRTSLKDLEIVMGFDKVEDLPFKFNHTLTREEREKVIEYNLNDVKATLMFYHNCIEAIRLRQKIGKKYSISCMNYSNTKIGSELLLKLYCQKTGQNPYDIRKNKTPRSSIIFKEIIFDYIKFNSKILNDFLEKLKSKTIYKTKGEFSESVIYKGFKYDYGLGGIHGSIRAGVYEANDNYIIKDADVASLYPSIAIVNRLFPEHLGEQFYEVYKEDIVDVRLAEKAKGVDGDKAIINGFKEAANASYGNSNQEYSWLYDPKYTMQTTINGQLMLTMLAEKLVDSIPDLTMIQVNTDGLTVKMLKSSEALYDTICKQWEKDTNLILEYALYSKMWIRDVNNYGALYTNGKVKLKGAFEIEKEYHKDPSDKIVAIALNEFYVNDTPIEQTIYNHTNIFDFCKRFKASHGWKSEIRQLSEDKSELSSIKCQKTNRYYISTNGGRYMKYTSDHKDRIIKEVSIEASHMVTIYNNHIPKDIKDYNIDYSYYIDECYKIINLINNKQLELF